MDNNDDEYMLTTVDNPYNPFSDYDSWFAFDQQRGYHTPSFLARIADFSLELSDADQDVALSNAIDEIVKENVLGIYKKIRKSDTIGDGSLMGGGVS